jgi:hypothetical protein
MGDEEAEEKGAGAEAEPGGGEESDCSATLDMEAARQCRGVCWRA